MGEINADATTCGPSRRRGALAGKHHGRVHARNCRRRGGEAHGIGKRDLKIKNYLDD